MKKIKLSQNKYALVDDIDFNYLNQYKWSAVKNSKTFYAVRNSYDRNGKKTMIKMHREIMQTPRGMETDHMDENGLNNQRNNLRICTHAENSRNILIRKDNKYGIKGVYWSKRDKIWYSRIQVNGKQIHLGSFRSKENAYTKYCEASKIYHGEFSKLINMTK